MNKKSFLKLLKIIVISLVVFLNSGTLLSANTVKEHQIKMSKFLDKGKLRGYIHSVLEMRDLKSMDFETYAALTWTAADILQQIGECGRAAEILDKLSKLRTNKISFDGISNLLLVRIRNTMTLCGRWNKKGLKKFIDKDWPFGMSHRQLYADSLAIYGLQSAIDNLATDIYAHGLESGYYYGKALGETLTSYASTNLFS